MSYCVNCGVELDKTCEVCPLCNTKVVNPKQPPDTTAPKPFPSLEGHAEPVDRADITILMTVMLATTAVVCGLLNLFFFQYGSWSLYVIGICVVLWIFFLPLFFSAKLNPYVSLLLDGMSIACLLYTSPGATKGATKYSSLSIFSASATKGAHSSAENFTFGAFT